MATNDIAAVAEYVRAELGPSEEWVRPAGYPDSLALCIIDSVYSLQAAYTSTSNVIAKYREVRNAQGADASYDGVVELEEAIEAAGGSEKAAKVLFNNDQVAPGTSRLKSVAVSEAASNLRVINIQSAAQLREALQNPDTEAEVRGAWRSVKGLGPVSWEYLRILCGLEAVKPDIWICRFVALALGEETVSAERAKAALTGAAAELGVALTTLDHAVWRFASDREALSE